ncbi:MAG: hypothetical protein DHS20C15_10460 [Planctomycetota bacterium]|nr:MAG: hypothetical protein DHS20C15_10460 [Planctomycetota bacterium]
MRKVLGVIAGYAAWTVLWLGGNAGIGAAYPEEFAAFNDGGSLTLAAPLALSLALSVVCSLLAGVITQRLTRCSRASILLALALLGTGLGVQLGAWERMPTWYHLSFLIPLLPVTWIGARLAKS